MHDLEVVANIVCVSGTTFLYSRRINAVLYLAMHSALLVLKHRSERNLTKEIKILKIHDDEKQESFYPWT